MASRTQCDPRTWKNFHSYITADGTRYRHQVKQHKISKTWWVRTEVWPEGEKAYFSADFQVPDRHGLEFFKMNQVWSNVDEEKNPQFPAGYEGGFKGLPE